MTGPRGSRIDTRMLSVDLIDEPDQPVRQTFGEAALAELAESIRQLGVLEPLLVRLIDGRYRVEAGHRRLMAARMAGLAAVPCLILGAAAPTSAAIKVHENVHREDLNPAEEAAFFAALLEQECGGDVDRLCELVHERREYVECRLLFLGGDQEIVAAVADGKISFAAGRELQRCKDDGYRRMYLDAAVSGGASARLVRDWVARANTLAAVNPSPEPDAAPAPGALLPPARSSIICFLCEVDSEPYDMELLYVHRTCRRVVLDRLLRRDREDGQGS